MKTLTSHIVQALAAKHHINEHNKLAGMVGGVSVGSIGNVVGGSGSLSNVGGGDSSPELKRIGEVCLVCLLVCDVRWKWGVLQYQFI